jgi:hypothetical protein
MKKQDLLWKGIIRELFSWFVQFFFENWQEEIDLGRGFEFLDKELEQILPESEAKGRRADVLVKVFSPAGKEFWFLVHVEVQGYHDEDFALRMYTIQYRLFDRYQKPVGALAIFTDSMPDFHPQKFDYQCLTTNLQYQFGTYKLLDHPPGTEISKKENPFSLVMEAAWYGLNQGKIKDEEALEMKVMLGRKLIDSGFSKKTIRSIFDFIKYYVSFDKKDFYFKFDEIMEPMKNSANMTLREMIIEDARQEGIEQGIDIGLLESVTVQKMLKEGKSPEEISKKLKIKKSTILKMKKMLDELN